MTKIIELNLPTTCNPTATIFSPHHVHYWNQPIYVLKASDERPDESKLDVTDAFEYSNDQACMSPILMNQNGLDPGGVPGYRVHLLKHAELDPSLAAARVVRCFSIEQSLIDDC